MAENNEPIIKRQETMGTWSVYDPKRARVRYFKKLADAQQEMINLVGYDRSEELFEKWMDSQDVDL